MDYLFRPQSVVVVGASIKPHGAGATLLANPKAVGFGGRAAVVVKPGMRC